MELMNSIKRAWIRHREYERVWAELAFSTDRQLADMGLARGDIADIASAHAEQVAAALVPGKRAAASRPASPVSARLRFNQPGLAR